MPPLKKKKKILLIILSQSRLTEVFGADLLSIEFVDPDTSGEVTPEEEVIGEADLTTDQVDYLNGLAATFK